MLELLPYLKLFRRHSGLMFIGLILSVCTLLASIGLLSLSGWFLTASAVAGLSILTKDQFNYMTPAGAVRFFSIVRTACRWGDRVVSHDATFRILTTLRVSFWKKLAPLSLHQLKQWRQGELLNRLVADIDALDNLYLRLITPIASTLLIIVALTLTMSLFDGHLALFMGGALLVVSLAIPLIFYQLGKLPGQQLILKQSHLRQATTTYLQFQSELLLAQAEPEFMQKVFDQEALFIQAQQRMTRINALATATMLTIMSSLMIAMLWFASTGVGAETQATPMTALMVFFALAAFESMQPLAGAFQYLSSTLTAAKRLNEIMISTPAIQFGCIDKANQSGNIQINDISFSYPDSSTTVLNQLQLHMKTGERIAVLGATGCGKSTLLSLLTRDWDASAGSILLGDQKIQDYSEAALRQMMSVVSQRVHIFSASLADNLRLAKPDASDEELLNVLHLVDLGNLLEDEHAKDSLQQWLGEGGRSLSGGEQRRISLARALLHNAPILLLDEATEGLDPATEKQMMNLILQYSQGKTVLMVTHRLTGLPQMDRIAIIQDGQFDVIDSHTHLLEKHEGYRQMFLRYQQNISVE